MISFLIKSKKNTVIETAFLNLDLGLTRQIYKKIYNFCNLIVAALLFFLSTTESK